MKIGWAQEFDKTIFTQTKLGKNSENVSPFKLDVISHMQMENILIEDFWLARILEIGSETTNALFSNDIPWERGMTISLGVGYCFNWRNHFHGSKSSRKLPRKLYFLQTTTITSLKKPITRFDRSKFYRFGWLYFDRQPILLTSWNINFSKIVKLCEMLFQMKELKKFVREWKLIAQTSQPTQFLHSSNSTNKLLKRQYWYIFSWILWGVSILI